MSDDTSLQQEAYQADNAFQQTQPRQALPIPPVPPRQPQGPAPRADIDPTFQPADVSFIHGGEATGQKPQGAFKDTTDRIWTSTLGLGTAALGLASATSRALGASPDVVQHIENGRKDLEDHIQATVQGMSPKGQMAMHAQLFGGGGTDADGQHIPTPGEVGWGRYVAGELADFVPSTVLAFLPGGLLGRVALAVGATARVARVAAAAGTAGAFGAVQGGQAYNAIVDQVDKTSDEEMQAGSPAYAALRDQGMDEWQAKSTIVGKVAPLIVAKQFGLGAATGVGLRGVLGEGALGMAGAGVAKRAAVGGAEGAGVMGAQQGGGDYLQQQAQQQLDQRRQFDPEELATQFASGALGGLLVGAGAGTLHSTPAKVPEPTPAAVGVDANTSMALQGALDLTGAPPGPVPASPQGELFRNIDQANPVGGANPPAATGDGSTTAPPPAGRSGPTSNAGTGKPAPAASSGGQGELIPTTVGRQVGAGVEPPPSDANTPIPGTNPATGRLTAIERLQATTDAVRAAAPPGGMPADGMKRGELIDAMSTLPDMDRRVLTRMSLSDLQARFNQQHVEPPAQPPAQPAVVQALDQQGNVVHERPTDAANPEQVMADRTAAHQLAPDGVTQVLTPEQHLDQQMKAEAAKGLDPTGEAHPVDAAANEAVEPTPAQAAAETGYQMGHVQLHGLDITVTTPKGRVRKGPVDEATGKPAYEATMPGHDGYIRGTIGADGEHVDTTLGPRVKAMFDGTPEQAAQEPVFVVDQIDPKNGKFDEHKAMIGYHTAAEATQAYDARFSDGSGPSRRGAVNTMDFAGFKDWLNKGDTTKAISYKFGDYVKARATARRELQKQKLAAPGERKVGRVESAGEGAEPAERITESNTPSRVPRTHDEAMQDLSDAFRALPSRLATPLSEAGARTAKQELAKFISQAPEGSGERGIHEAIARWGTSREDPIPGTKVRRGEIANNVLQLMSGKDLNAVREETMRRLGVEGRRDMQGQATGAVEGGRRVTAGELEGEDHGADTRSFDEEGNSTIEGEQEEPAVEGAEEGEAAEPEEKSVGVTKYTEVAPNKERSSKTTDLERVGTDLVSKIVNGKMDAAEAAEAYGKQKPGAKRRWADFATFLKDRIDLATNGEAEKTLKAAAEKLTDPAITKQAKARLEQVSARMAELGNPKHVQALKDMLREVEDPVGAAADREAKLKDALSGRQGSPAAHMNQRLRDNDINGPVRRMVFRLDRSGATTSARSMLDAVINNDATREAVPQMHELATRLRDLVPEETQVMTPDTAARTIPGYDPEEDLNSAGAWYPAQKGEPDTIVLNPTNPQHTETIIHETLHAVTGHYINKLIETGGHTREYQALKQIGLELRNAVEAAGSAVGVHARGEVDYALSDAHELHTALLSNPYVQQIAATHVPSIEFKQAMARLGYFGTETKSVWSAFTGFVRRMLGMDRGTASLLDHAMRPLGDLIDKSDTYNKLRAAGEDVGRLGQPKRETLDDVSAKALTPLKGAARNTLASIDPKGINDRLRKFWLLNATRDGMVKWNGDTFQDEDRNPLKDWRTADEAREARKTAFVNTYADRTADLIKMMKGPHRDDTARLMNDATIAQMHLGEADPAKANAHLVSAKTGAMSDADTNTLKDLTKRFNALPDAGKSAYRGFRDYYRETYGVERDAQLRSMVKRALPDLDEAQTNALAKAATTAGGLKGLREGTFSPLLKDIPEPTSKLIKLIAQVHSQGFVQGDYFPLRRRGAYVVRYGDKGSEDYGVEMFEKRSQAEERRLELLKSAGTDVSQVMSKYEPQRRSMVPTTVVDEILKGMRKDPALSAHTDEMGDLLQNIMLQHASHSEVARSRMRRQGVKGASLDVEKTIARDMLGTASRVGYLEHGPEAAEARAAMQRHADYLGRTGGAGDQIRAQAVVDEVAKRAPAGDDDSSAFAGLGRAMSNFGYIQSLMSPSHMITSTLEAHMNSTAMLGARHGAAAAPLAIAKSMRDLMPLMSLGAKHTLKAVGVGLKAADWNLANVARDRFIEKGANAANMRDLFDGKGGLNAAGLIDHSMTREMQRMANPGRDVTRGWWGKFMDMNGAMAHTVDVMNKSAIAKAAYDLELRKNGGDHDGAKAYAVQTARDAMPNYNAGNKNRLSSGALMGPLTQFKQYGFHMYSVMANLAKSSLHGASAEERKQSRLALAGILATHSLVAGAIAGSPLGDDLRWIGGAYDWFSGAAKPHDYENDVRSWVADAFGPEVGELVTRGVTHAVGIDVHRRVGLSNLLEPPELNSFDKNGVLQAIASAMTGASGEDAISMAQGIGKLFNGDIEGGLKAALPRVVRDPLKAMALAEQGVTDSKGRTVLSPDKIGLGGIAAQAVGFQPSTVTEFREGRAAVQEAKQEGSAAKSATLAKILQADPDERGDIMQEFNARHPGERITYATVLKAQQEARSVARQKTDQFGVPLSRAQRAGGLSSAEAFANFQ